MILFFAKFLLILLFSQLPVNLLIYKIKYYVKNKKT